MFVNSHGSLLLSFIILLLSFTGFESSYFLAIVNNRKSQGIPEQWFVVDDWLDERKIPPYPKNEEVALFKKKFENIPMLADYTVIPDDSF